MKKTAIFLFKLTILAASFCLTNATAFAAETSDTYTQAENDQTGEASIEQIQQAAKTGDPDAQYALGYLYYYGRGVKQDMNQAKIYINKAAEQGQEQAIQAQKILFNAGLMKKQGVKQVAADEPPAKQTASLEAAQTSSPEKKSPANTTLRTSQGKYYTLQLLGSHKQADIDRFIKTAGLSQAEAHYYHTYLDGKDWYVLTYGKYPSPQAAKLAVRRLPEAVQAKHPWVKPSSLVEKEMRRKQPN